MDPLSQVLTEVQSAFVQAGIRYAIGGSLASSARGLWRTTFDIDVVAAIAPAQAMALVAALGSDWYADADIIRSAIAAARSFNLIHIRLAYKVDIFPASEDFHHVQIERASVMPVGMERVPCPVTSAEDILLAKLRWYRDGGMASDRQWNDVVGLITSNPSLDSTYLDDWVNRLHVADLLAKARADAEA